MRTQARNADLADLAELLKEQHARKLDVVAPAEAISARDGRLVLAGTEAVVDESGVTRADGVYRPTAVAIEGVASKLGIPTGYLKSLHAERPDLFDATVNGFLHGGNWHRTVLDRHGVGPDLDALPGFDPDEQTWESGYGSDPRKFLVRSFRGDNGGVGITRAFLSDSYKMIDNLDVLTSALQGVRDSGMSVEIEACDLTERRMYVRIVSREVRALAPDLIGNYRSPFSGNSGREMPVVFAGFVIANSEVGHGALTLTPRIVWEVCSNGQTFSKDALRNVHLGGKLDEGVIRWSDDTMQRNLDLVASQTKDAVSTFLDVDYVRGKLDEIRAEAGVEIENPADVVSEVGKRLRYTEEQTDGILNHFIRGGDPTSGGVMQAVTAYARTVDDADTAFDLEDSAMDALHVAATASG